MSKSIVHTAHDPDGKRMLIVDKKDADKDSLVCWVTKHGQVLKKNETPTEEHKYHVKSIGGDNKKTYTMIRTEKGTFKMFDKRKAPSKKEKKASTKKPKKSNLTPEDVKAIVAELKE